MDGYHEYVTVQEHRKCMMKTASSCNRDRRWEKPKPSWVKVNWDAFVCSTLKKVGTGVVIRDEEGEVLASLCFVTDCLQDPLVGGAIALRRAVLLCDELGLSLVVLEGDSQIIVKAANSKDDLATAYGNVVDEVRGLL